MFESKGVRRSALWTYKTSVVDLKAHGFCGHWGPLKKNTFRIRTQGRRTRLEIPYPLVSDVHSMSCFFVGLSAIENHFGRHSDLYYA